MNTYFSLCTEQLDFSNTGFVNDDLLSAKVTYVVHEGNTGTV